MIIQKNNQNIRLTEGQKDDISYLREYYHLHGRFPLFQQVLIETRTDCNNHCPFCPHHFNQKDLGIMEWDCFTHIIDSLVEMNYNGRVALMISNEPLLEVRLEDMVAYARTSSPRLFLDITTNGRLLTLEKIDRLMSLGIDNININDYRGDRKENPDGLSPNLIPIYQMYFNNPKVTFKRRSFSEKWPNYGGNIPQSFNPSQYGFCNFPFRKLNISYTGEVILCCDDFMYDTSFGNVMSRSLEDCWNDEDYNKIRLALLDNRRISICSKCNDGQNYGAF